MFSLTPDDFQAIRLSLQVATAATLIGLPFGIGVSYLLVFTKIPGKAIIEGVVNLPLVLPPVVVGYLLLLLFGKNGWLGSLLLSFDIRVIFTLTGAVIASTVVGFPLLVRSVRIGMESIDYHYVQASRTLGAGWWDSLSKQISQEQDALLLTAWTFCYSKSIRKQQVPAT